MSALQCALMPWRAARRIQRLHEDMSVFIRLTADLLRQIPEDERPREFSQLNNRSRHLHAVR